MNALFIQLPLNPSAPLESTGNVPLAGAMLAAAAGLPPNCLVQRDITDSSSDSEILRYLMNASPSLVAFTIYMWNAERSASLAGRIKKLLPETLVVAGGPEVTEDNVWLRNSGGFDLLVSGEGEELAGTVLNPSGARDLACRNNGFLRSGSLDFIPGTYPDPWLSGYLDPGGASVQIETIRGCSGGCDYCSYRRLHSNPRYMPPENVIKYAGKLADLGAGELVFLDPTFNSRPDLKKILKGLAGMGPKLFGEMRGDLITQEMAELIAAAGFESVEIGLQSCRRESLEASGRSGDPLKVLEGAMNLKRAGVRPIMDLILGLPGDTPADSISAAAMIADRNLHNDLQVFHLSVLPGTALRDNMRNEYMDRPPYYRFSDPGMGGFSHARQEIADMVGYDLDMETRPLLFDGWPGTVEIEMSGEKRFRPTSYRHSCLRIRSRDMWTDRKGITGMVGSFMRTEPFCTLDVILMPSGVFPLDLLDMIRNLDIPWDYTGRVAGVLGREGNLRLAVLIEERDSFPVEWLTDAARQCTVVLEAECPSQISDELWNAGICTRLPGVDWDLTRMESEVPSLHQVFFRERSMEELWTRKLQLC